MPHVNIKLFPRELTAGQKHEIATRIASILCDVLGCKAGDISVALEPVAKDLWQQAVYIPEIERKKKLLCKFPDYSITESIVKEHEDGGNNCKRGLADIQ